MSWASKLAKPYRVEEGNPFRLQDFDPGETGKLRAYALLMNPAAFGG